MEGWILVVDEQELEENATEGPVVDGVGVLFSSEDFGRHAEVRDAKRRASERERRRGEETKRAH